MNEYKILKYYNITIIINCRHSCHQSRCQILKTIHCQLVEEDFVVLPSFVDLSPDPLPCCGGVDKACRSEHATNMKDR